MIITLKDKNEFTKELLASATNVKRFSYQNYQAIGLDTIEENTQLISIFCPCWQEMLNVVNNHKFNEETQITLFGKYGIENIIIRLNYGV